ncbi:nuclear mRNA export, poly(A)+RNA binding protein [Linnemannia zychae]|nr:nuclear mRNA export, poly(A)+RNA binding protein [Linnemannia zychae]
MTTDIDIFIIAIVAEEARDNISLVTVQNKDSQGQTNAQNILNDPGLGDFLCRKAHPTTITPSNPRYNEMKNSMSFLVGDLEQAQALRSLSGIYYNAQKLLITTSADQGQIQDRTHYNKATIEAVRTFIQSRHNDGFLNLERMAADPILHQGHFIPPGQNSGRHDSGSLLFKTAAELFPKVTTISLAHNNLTSLQSISTLGQYYPNLLHLSLKGNNISTLDELQNLCRNGRLQHLTELILVDNPVREMEIQAHGNDCINYKSNVTRLIPSLERLDGTEVPKISFGLDIGLKELSKVSLPAPVRGNFFDSAETQSTVLEFLTRMFDTDRASLGHIYHPHGTFSYTAIPESSLRQTQRQGHSFGYQSNTPLRQSVWTEYTSRSRNLLTISDPSIREKTLFVGNQMIVQQSLLRLPMTAHDLSDDSKICVDAWQTGSLFPEGAYIFASVHGEFEEQRRGVLGSSTRKSFDRTFVLAPAPADSFAAQNGWRCVIISDQLTIREHKGHESWNPEIPLNVAASLAEAVDGVANAKLLHLSGGISEEQNAKAQELMRLSGLVYQYAVQALVTSGWDLGQALAAVQAARGTLPPNAWQIS